MKPPLTKKMAAMTVADWRAWYARILNGEDEPDCNTGNPEMKHVFLPEKAPKKRRNRQ